MADEFTRAGLRLVAGGTDTHLMLVDVSVKGLTGKAVEAYLDEIGITVNKNAIPFDTAEAHGRQRHPHRHAGDHRRAVWAPTSAARSRASSATASPTSKRAREIDACAAAFAS